MGKIIWYRSVIELPIEDRIRYYSGHSFKWRWPWTETYVTGKFQFFICKISLVLSDFESFVLLPR